MDTIIKETIIDPNKNQEEIKIEVTSKIILEEEESLNEEELSNLKDDKAKYVIKKFKNIEYDLSTLCLDGDFQHEEHYNNLIKKERNSAREAISIIFESEAMKCIAWIGRLEN